MIRLLFPALCSLLLLLLYNIPSIVVVVARDLPLEVARPRVLAHASSRGFHRHLTLHEQDVFGQWTTRFHNVRLHGGIVAVGEYYARIKIGGQTLRVQIDTGSATLAVPMKECRNCRKGDMRYSVEKSNSGKALILSCLSAACETDTCRPFGCGACSSKRNSCCALSDKSKCAFHLSFGDGSGAKGVLVRDVLQFGQDKFPVTFGGIREDSPDFERKQVDGILGMAYPPLACNPSCVKPTFESAMDFLKLKNLFTICMTDSDGRIILGDFDASLNKTAITWVPMQLSTPPSFYDVKLLGNLKIGSRHVELPSYRKAIVDSGTTLIVFSHEAFNMILNHLQTHYCHIPGLCNRKTWFRPAHCVHISDHYRLQLPTLVFQLQGFNITLDASEYMINYKSRGPEYWCVGLMALNSMSGGVDVIFGNTVMKKYLTVYDRQNKRLGFAETYGTCSGKTPTAPVPQKIPAATHHPTPIGLGKKHKSKNHANATNQHCAVAKTCAKCAKISSPNCFWDTAGSRCVPGEPTRFMCFIDGVAGKVGYFIGGVIGIATLVVAVLAVAICTYKKRQTAAEEAAVDAEERESVMQPLTRDPS